MRLIHKLPVDDAKEGVHHEEEDELPTDEFVQGALVTGVVMVYWLEAKQFQQEK